ncbi:MAG TPA: DUF4199 domain-containing protein [Flavobacterium sp.]|nr:DUF4199 domain-containing protein [Flavobacterium sp.]
MENTTTVTPAKSAIQYGVIFGIIMVLEFVIGYVMNFDPISDPWFGTTINVLNYFILPILLITIGINNYKKLNHGFISFSQCLKIGVTICIIAGLIYAIFSAIFMTLFPEFVDELLAKTRSALAKTEGMTDEGMEVALSWTKKFMSPVFAVPATLLMFSFIGLIYSLIIGAIMKNNKPEVYS